MLAKFVNAFASRPKQSVILWLVILVFGVLSYLVLLPREGFPPVDVPISVGAGGYFVDDQDKVDADVTQPLADAVLALPEVESVQSFSRDSSFTVLANLESGVTSIEGAALMDGVVAGLTLPPEAQIFTQSIDAARFLAEGYDILIAVYGGVGTSGEELEAAANAIVGQITHPDIASAQVEEIFDSGINPATGEEVVLEVGFNQLSGEDDKVFRPSIAIGVKANPDVDSLGIRDATDEALERARADLPEGFEAVVALDFATLVRQQISSLQGNVLLGIFVVAIVALLMISWRASIVTALFIFTVLAASVGGLYIAGISLNTISLFALILALGLFVDDAIVITESIDAFREDGDEDLSIIRRAITRVGSASVSGTLTTVLVFAPMLLIGGILGGFIRILPITVILALLTSLILSLVFIPVAARYLTLRAPRADGPVVRVEAKLARAISSLPGTRGRKGILIAVLGFALSLVMFFVGTNVFAPKVGFNIFPPAKDSINIALEITYPPGTSIEDAKAIALDVNQQASDELGSEMELGYLYIGDQGSALAQFNLTPIGGRPTVHELVDQLQPIGDAEQNARVIFSAISNGPPELLFPYTMQIFGEDLDTLAAAAETMRADLDGRQLELPNGDAFTVLETDVALDDVVAREDGRRLVEVRARFDDDSVTSTTAATQEYFEDNYTAEDLAALGLEADALGFDFGLESDNQESFSSLPLAFGIALLAMLVLLIIQFRSSAQWLLVFLAIPFSFFGVFGGLLITDNPVSFFVMLGLIGLIGIAVNNTILLVDFANQERALGFDRRQAIENAVRRRFRPLVATSFTTVGGLLPLALSDPFWEGLAFTIIFGLLSSTFLVIMSFPYYYLAIEALRDRFTTPWRRSYGEASTAD
ncbi:MAG: efflux RND transporter permease subunit [Acidimicrobiales bacterium]|nr:efflux RND transporter permease subunit [Acidimicrobiales bacterium]RZV47783.1 MAG: efflux RND transporter permease subunit [Acidimicrobiales bacterium]